MATTGPFHGKSGVVYLTAVQVKYAIDWTYGESGNEAEKTAGGDSAKSWLVGLPDGGGSVGCRWDPSDSTGQESLSVGDSVTLILYPDGNTTGDSKLEGSVVIQSIDRDWSYEGVPGFKFNYRGFLTLGEVPA